MIAIVLGTRPEIIKMSPVIRECESKGIDYFTLHTGQHYSYEMDRTFFEDQSRKFLMEEMPDILVQEVRIRLSAPRMIGECENEGCGNSLE